MEEILTLAKSVSGAEEAEEALLEALCEAAQQRWLGRLRQGVTAEDCGPAFPCAVACDAAADLAECRQVGGTAAFTAGVLSIQEADAAERSGRAASLRRTAERLMAPYAEPDNLSFKGVRG
jgi:hypothetical protein